MLMRQDSSLSSSRRLATATPPPETHHAKAIGCMSGIFQLFSKYQNSNKRLTFGKKREKSNPSSSTKDKASEQTKDSLSLAKDDKTESQISGTKRLSLDINVPRSPTLRPEIRRSNTVKSPESSKTTPSSLVARLMGLGDITVSAVKKPALGEETIAEKRRQLIRALEKCNQDLEGLKRVIEAVQTVDVGLQQQPQVAANKFPPGGRNTDSLKEKSCKKTFTTDMEAEELNSARVMDDFTSSPLSGFAIAHNHTGTMSRFPQHRKFTASKKPGEDDDGPIATFVIRRQYCAAASLLPRSTSTTVAPKIQSVEEVCKDIAWGEKREMGRIVVVLQDYLCKDLIEEVVKELKYSCYVHSSLPLEACKRRLCF